MSVAQASTTERPAVLVTTEWARAHLDDPSVRFLEVDVDTEAYDSGHLPGAVGIDWKRQLTDPVRRDLASSHTWFVLHELLAYENVRNCDGSWTEYGSLVGVPIETGDGDVN